MPHWTKICAVADCPSGTAREFVAGDRIVAVFRVGEEWHALDGICPHQGGPLGKGALSGCILTCPWHGWQFDVTTGQHQSIGTLRQPRLAVQVEGDDVFVDLEP